MEDTPEINLETPSLLSTLKGPELKEFREKQDYKSRLAEQLTGIPIEDNQALLSKVISDKKRFHLELAFPQPEGSVHQPDQYRQQLLDRANQEGIQIISFDQVPDWVLAKDSALKNIRENTSAMSGCYSEDLDSIVVTDPSTEDPQALRVLAHELVHALDYKSTDQSNQKYSIEELEYRAYLLSGLSEKYLSSEDGDQALDVLFGDFMVAGSSLSHYFGQAVDSGKCQDYGQFSQLAKDGEIFIPWYSSVPEEKKD